MSLCAWFWSVAIDVTKPTITCPPTKYVTVTRNTNDDDDDDGHHHDDDDDGHHDDDDDDDDPTTMMMMDTTEEDMEDTITSIVPMQQVLS